MIDIVKNFLPRFVKDRNIYFIQKTILMPCQLMRALEYRIIVPPPPAKIFGWSNMGLHWLNITHVNHETKGLN